MTDGFRVAAIQAAPVFLDKAASTTKACALIEEAAAGGAVLAAFGETWLPGYPRWVNAPISAGDKRRLGGRYLESSVLLDGPEMAAIRACAARCSIDVVIGIAELDPVSHGSTYCTLAFIGSDGSLLGRHRKLKPTSGERIAWADGDASGLRVHRRAYGTISGLNCWEHNMVLPGYVLMAEGTQVHVAAFPGYETSPSSTRQVLLSRAFASQGACYVMLVGGMLGPADVADADVRESVALMPPMTGDSYVFDPSGEIVAGPVLGEQVLFADIDPERIRCAKAMTDIAGHYSRPDVLRVVVDRGLPRRVVEES